MYKPQELNCFPPNHSLLHRRARPRRAAPLLPDTRAASSPDAGELGRASLSPTRRPSATRRPSPTRRPRRPSSPRRRPRPPLLGGDRAPALLLVGGLLQLVCRAAAASACRPPSAAPVGVRVPDGRSGRGGFRLANVSP
jgi:hypothetical protein